MRPAAAALLTALLLHVSSNAVENSRSAATNTLKQDVQLGAPTAATQNAPVILPAAALVEMEKARVAAGAGGTAHATL